MDPAVNIVTLPLSWFISAICGLIFVLGVFFVLVRYFVFKERKSGAATARDWSIPTVDAQADRDSPFHRWDPRIKIASLLFFMFCAASLTQHLWACLALIGSVFSIGVARIPFRFPLRRITAMGAFLGMFLVVMPMTVPAKAGDTLIVFERVSFISFSLRGFALAVLICVKASAIALLAEPLLATSPFSVTVRALAGLKTPPVVCRMILLTHRYIFVFQDEVRRMTKGMAARGFRKRTDMETLRTVGNFLGMLLVRSFERTQRVYDAMLARGYDGASIGVAVFRARRADWLKGTFWVCAGLALVIADRFWKAFPPWVF